MSQSKDTEIYRTQGAESFTFQARVDYDAFRSAVSAAAAVADEAVLRITEEVVSIHVADFAQTVLVEVDDPCIRQADGTLEAGVALDDLVDALPDRDTFDLIVDYHGDEQDDEANALVVRSHGTLNEVMVFNPGTIRTPPDQPKLNGETIFKYPAHRLAGLLYTFTQLEAASYVEFHPCEAGVAVEVYDAENVLLDNEIITADVEPADRAVYSVGMLRSLVDGLRHRQEYVTVQFGSQELLHVDDDAYQYYVAPRIFMESQEGDA